MPSTCCRRIDNIQLVWINCRTMTCFELYQVIFTRQVLKRTTTLNVQGGRRGRIVSENRVSASMTEASLYRISEQISYTMYHCCAIINANFYCFVLCTYISHTHSLAPLSICTGERFFSNKMCCGKCVRFGMRTHMLRYLR